MLRQIKKQLDGSLARCIAMVIVWNELAQGRSTPQKLVDFFQNLPQSFLFSTFFNKKHLKTLLYQHLFSYYKNVVVSI